MIHETETIDRLFLELSQFTKATTRREADLEKALRELVNAAGKLYEQLFEVGEKTDWKDGDQTDMVVAWYQIEPLHPTINRAQEVLQSLLRERFNRNG